jgi:hypothetical protein
MELKIGVEAPRRQHIDHLHLVIGKHDTAKLTPATREALTRHIIKRHFNVSVSSQLPH